MMQIVVRADGDDSIGSGHVMRCLALARQMQRQGATVRFACARLGTDLERRLRRQGIHRITMEEEPGTGGDRRMIAAIARRLKPRWVILDGYAFDAGYRQNLRQDLDEVCTGLMAIDDLGGDFRAADLVLNANFHARPQLYPGMPRRRLLMGPRYALLREQFEEFRQWQRPVCGDLRRIAVIAGADPPGVMPEVAAALARWAGPTTRVDVIGVDRQACLAALPETRRFFFHGRVEDVTRLLVEADVAVATAGSICFELLMLQLPAILVPVAKNQLPLAREVAKIPGFSVIWDQHQLDEIGNSLERLSDPGLRAEAARRAREIIDGRGSRRVWARMQAREIRLRPVGPDDAELLLQWANEAGVRRQAFHRQVIDDDEHWRWFQRRLCDGGCRIFVGEYGPGQALGQVRFEQNCPGEAVVSISLDRSFRGRGLAPILLEAAMEEVQEEVEIFHAYIRPDNRPSRRLFESLGYRLQGPAQIAGNRGVHYIYQGG